jgi:3-oxoacyl-[acyl-carrier-protein] synthase-1
MNRDSWSAEDIFIVGVGAQTPVGRSALKAAAAVRCGISAYQEHDFMIDRYGEPFVVAPADWLPSSLPPHERMARFASDAIVEAVQSLQAIVGNEPTPLLLALPAARLPEGDSRQFVIRQIHESLGQGGLSVETLGMAEGNAIGVCAIQQAASRLRGQRCRLAIVAGVDSHLGAENLERIDHSGRLHSVNNSWGFTPGEGSGAIVLTTGAVVNRFGVAPLARIAGVGVGEEAKLLGTKTVCIGEGLTEAFRGALSTEDKVAHGYCDLNGETYRADEFGFAVIRNREGFYDAGSFTAAAECWGDVGTATIPLQVSLATSAWARGYAKGSSVVCWSSSATEPLRGAVRLTNTWHGTEGR